MKIEGYHEHEPAEAVWEVQVYLSVDVTGYFEVEGKQGNRNAKHVMKAKATLKSLKRHGLDRVKGTLQFKREGKFPSGRRRGGEQVVYEAKSDQVRVYGGPITVGGKTAFYFIEAVTKKENKADQKLLQRVAKALGAINDELEARK